MANSLTLAQNWTNILDQKYRQASKTSVLETDNTLVGQFDNAGTIQIADVAMTGLGDYDRANGFPKGDLTTTWTSYTISNDRGKEFIIDAKDNEEQGWDLFGVSAREFMDLYVIPEVDATRFAKMAANAGNTSTTALTVDNILSELDDAEEAMMESGVPAESWVHFMSNSTYKLLKNAGGISRDFNVQSGQRNLGRTVTTVDGVPIIRVPQNRFYTQITLNDGSSAWGYVKTDTTGKDINFMTVYTGAVNTITRHSQVRNFSPQVNQDAEAWKFQYRLYHDLFVLSNRQAGIYMHNVA